MKSYGFIGCGNMGSALARAICRRIDVKQLYLSNRDPDKAEKLAMELHANVSDRVSIAKECDCIFLGVIPQAMEKLLADIRPFLQERKKAPLLVSMAASLTIGEIGEMAGGNVPVVRIMPNTPVSVGEGVILYACGDRAGPKETEQLINVLEAAGLCMEMQEEQIDAATALTGCGPAFVQMFIGGLADGALACGVPRKEATLLAAQMLIGSAKLTLLSGRNPGALKEEVCSPGGTTIQGVRVLEERAFSGAAMDAVIAAYEKTKASVK